MDSKELAAVHLNAVIKECAVDTNQISDGFHTFGELYDHRIALFIALCRKLKEHAWVALAHEDGSKFEGWFLLGLFRDAGKQITYHLPMRYLDRLNGIEIFSRSPVKWDGHTPKDVEQRLLLLGAE